jgi:hypothetical protein
MDSMMLVIRRWPGGPTRNGSESAPEVAGYLKLMRLSGQ